MRGPVRLPLEQLQPFLFEIPESLPIEWPGVFGNDHPVEIEVGFGKGLFLLTASQQRPEVNFFGIEIERKYQLFTANRVAKRNLRNVRLASTDARALLRDRVPARSVQAVHVYFPDPWWKTRHHKRRLFTREFAGACAQVLRDGGRLEVLTDVEDYYGIITGLIAEQPLLCRLPAVERAENHLTNFERKYRQAGKPIYGASYAKVAEH
ncbi:MAG TPA: tRNA (guanosine(46)-N7)-methyltransferase TrmB [Gemmataceae bacterium]|nr:tRNA (guanosine(46)-N7)-methyltransferase TrmB [Gemmataceae bacterium]